MMGIYGVMICSLMDLKLRICIKCTCTQITQKFMSFPLMYSQLTFLGKTFSTHHAVKLHKAIAGGYTYFCWCFIIAVKTNGARARPNGRDLKKNRRPLEERARNL